MFLFSYPVKLFFLLTGEVTGYCFRFFVLLNSYYYDAWQQKNTGVYYFFINNNFNY